MLNHLSFSLPSQPKKKGLFKWLQDQITSLRSVRWRNLGAWLYGCTCLVCSWRQSWSIVVRIVCACDVLLIIGYFILCIFRETRFTPLYDELWSTNLIRTCRRERCTLLVALVLLRILDLIAPLIPHFYSNFNWLQLQFLCCIFLYILIWF